jgi:hypothetical protein
VSQFGFSNSPRLYGGSNNIIDYNNLVAASIGRPHEMYPVLYPTSDDVESVSYGMYRRIIGRTTILHKSADLTSDPSLAFGLALQYFNKTPISFTAILNNYIYPGIIYGAASFRAFIHDFAKTIKENEFVGQKDDTNNINKAKNNVIFNYLSNFGNTTENKDGNTALEIIDDTLNQNKNNLENDGSYINICKEFDRAQDKMKVCGNVYNGASIGSNFFNNMLNSIGKPKSDVHLIFGTDFYTSLMHIDAACTYVSMLTSLVKYISYYSFRTKSQEYYSNVEQPEPYQSENLDLNFE